MKNILLTLLVLLSFSTVTFAQGQHQDHDNLTTSQQQDGEKNCCQKMKAGSGNSVSENRESEQHDMGGMMNVSHTRHHFAMMNGVDAAYKDEENPLEATLANIAAGETLYQQNCASCHGRNGVGDGEAGRDLDPAPTNIARFAGMKMASDGYLLWTIAEGGAPIGSAKPAFKEVLSREQSWQIVLYLRQLGSQALGH
ncbi:MAG: cytochrome c [Gammaproteobacteria bacterium]|jgi:mono/diheme cytochrome c family protein|nr:cytochrome c [Gammaproteobacteria bacterium]|tara:strand:- start:2219 stop:2809 length:591 start_codon:yes stop_codon:yes gene_type:complete